MGDPSGWILIAQFLYNALIQKRFTVVGNPYANFLLNAVIVKSPPLIMTNY